jgi:uncharacterized membrane protein YphA (DoxX/SURF4 family)
MFEVFFKEKLAPLTLRLALGLICVYHGFGKIMIMGGLNWNPALSPGWQLLIAWGEFVFGVTILLGFYCRVSATAILALMIGYLAWWQGWRVFHLPLNSLETTIVLMLVAITLVFLGAGELSLDARGGTGKEATASKGSGKKRAAA